ncbi:MAG: prepilin-type N-terminal cleavage/methylation domain-containing protein [Candidatus Sungbacteria bacterium]|nr:prepilin-type N-terminal cleavage/methylation domain-containing protein [Candidatus Sungbacteria bacterium]
MIRNQKGYSFVELMCVVVILGVVAAGSMTYLRTSTVIVVGHMVQIAMTNLASEQAGLKYPAAVTIADLKSYGVGSMLDDYVIDSYARTGTPLGRDYELELKAPDGTTLLCLTEATLVKAAC